MQLSFFGHSERSIVISRIGAELKEQLGKSTVSRDRIKLRTFEGAQRRFRVVKLVLLFTVPMN
jgi:hypothetical protein